MKLALICALILLGMTLIPSPHGNAQNLPTISETKNANPLLKPSELISFPNFLKDQRALAVADYAGWLKVERNFIGSIENKWLISYNADRKTVNWQKPIVASLSYPMTYNGKHIYVALRDGTLKKIAPTDGKTIWSITLDSYLNREIVFSNGNLILVSAGHLTYHIDNETGKNIWVTDLVNIVSPMVTNLSKPLIAGGHVFVGMPDGALAILDARSGALKSKFEPIYSNARFKGVVGLYQSSPGKLLAVRYDGYLLNIDISDSTPSSFSLIWKKQFGSIANALHVDDSLFLATVAGDLFRLNDSTGSQIWRSQIHPALSQMEYHEGKICLTSSTGFVGCVSQKEGKTIWHDFLDARLVSKIQISQGQLYVSTGYRSIYSYGL